MTPHIQIKAVGWLKDLSFSPQLFGSDWRHDVATESNNQYVHNHAYNELFIIQDISGSWRYLPSAWLLWYVLLHTVFKEEDTNIGAYKLSKTPYEFWFRKFWFRIMDAASDMVDQHPIPGFHEARWGGRGLRKSKSTFASGRKWATWPLHEGYQHDYSLKFEISYYLTVMSSIGFCVVCFWVFYISTCSHFLHFTTGDITSWPGAKASLDSADDWRCDVSTWGWPLEGG